MTINDVIKLVLDGVNPHWNTLCKIRYVYLTVGKYLQKNTDFFFSVDKKLAEKNLDIQDIKNIYEDDKTDGDLKVICRSAAYILESIYTELGIKSKLVKSNNNVINYADNGEELEINHWFLAAYDSDGKAYFLTLASDLPYIQMGMQTKHFASNIPYKKIQKNGEEIQVYVGDEIKHTVLTDKDLRIIDEKIGYLDTYYMFDEEYKPSKREYLNYTDASLALLAHSLKSNKMYIELEEKSTRFYHRLVEFESNGEKKSLYDMTSNDLDSPYWDEWIRKLCKYVTKRIENIIEYKIYLSKKFKDPDWNYDEWIKEVCVQIQRHLFTFMSQTNDSLYIDNNFKYNKWSRSMKNALKDDYNVYDVDNVLIILDRTNTLVSSLINKKYNPNFMKIFGSLSSHFISKSHLLECSIVDGYVSSMYITHKFKKLFKKVFGCNKEIRTLNKMEYSEQIVIIKMIIDKMFPELTKNNAALDETYNENYSIVQNRIQIYSVKNKDSGEYALVFHIVGDDTYGDTYYFYDPKLNTFSVADILDIYTKYIIVSDRLKTRIEEMEDITQEKKNKR